MKWLVDTAGEEPGLPELLLAGSGTTPATQAASGKESTVRPHTLPRLLVPSSTRLVALFGWGSMKYLSKNTSPCHSRWISHQKYQHKPQEQKEALWRWCIPEEA